MPPPGLGKRSLFNGVADIGIWPAGLLSENPLDSEQWDHTRLALSGGWDRQLAA